MEVKMKYMEEEGIVYGTVTGTVTWDDEKKLCEDYLKFVDDHGTYKLLSDEREAKLAFSMLEYDNLPNLIKELGVTSKHILAIVYNPSEENHRKYFKSLTRIASYNFQIFTDVNKAMDWLLEKDNE